MKRYLLSFILIFIDVVVLFLLLYLLNLDLMGVILVSLIFFYYEGIYTLRYDFWQEIKRVLKALFFSYLMVLTILVIIKSNIDYSVKSITLFFIIAMFMIPISKRLAKAFIYSIDFFKQKVLVLGSPVQSELLKKEIRNNWYLGQVYSKNDYDSVIITSKDIDKKHLNKVISKYLSDKSEVYVVPYITDINFSNSNILEYSNIRVNTIKIENRLLIKRNIWIKNIFDILLSFLVLPLLIPIHLLISLFIKFDSKGKIFFKQHRLGRNNIDFKCYKYRTMYENSESLLKKYLDNNRNEVEYYNKYHKYKNDPRITKIGRLLRVSSLDELPQIINILRGEMSFVGPRPYMLDEAKQLGSNQDIILKVKPGITGLWQVSGRNNLTFKDRNILEIWYIKNWSLWSDFVIMIKTIKVVLLKIGAR